MLTSLARYFVLGAVLAGCAIPTIQNANSNTATTNPAESLDCYKAQTALDNAIRDRDAELKETYKNGGLGYEIVYQKWESVIANLKRQKDHTCNPL